MTERDIQRVERDVEDLLVRVRKLETLDSTAQRSVIIEFRDLQKQVREMDIEGTHLTRERLRTLEATVGRIETDLKAKTSQIETDLKSKADAAIVAELRQDQKDNRRLIKTALYASVFSLGGGIILWLIDRVSQ